MSSYTRSRCPFCLERTGSLGSTPWGKHFSINNDTGWGKCFRCEARANIRDLKRYNVSLDTPVCDDVSYKLYRNVPLGYIALYPLDEVITSPIIKNYAKYCLERNVSVEAFELFKIGVILGESAPKHLAGAIVMETRDALYPGWIYRLRIGGYRSPGIAIDEGALFDGDALLHGIGDVYVVEGPFDRLCIYPQVAICTYGKDISTAQIERLCRYKGRVIFALDGDAWRDSQAFSLELALAGHNNSYWVRLPPGRDPGEIGLREIKNLELHPAEEEL